MNFALGNFSNFKPSRLGCFSSDYVGGSGSDYGASSFGGGGGGGALTQQILGSVALAGENIALHETNTGLVVPQVGAPVTTRAALNATAFGNVGAAPGSTWIILLIVAFLAFFAFKEL